MKHKTAITHAITFVVAVLLVLCAFWMKGKYNTKMLEAYQQGINDNSRAILSQLQSSPDGVDIVFKKDDGSTASARLLLQYPSNEPIQTQTTK